MRMFASLVVAGALSTVAVADDGAVKMTRAELQSFLPGTNVTHTNKGGSLRRWTNEADGTLVASTNNKGTYGSAYGTSSVSATGTWMVDEKGKYCINIDWKRVEEKWCSSILKAGDSYYLGLVDPAQKIEFAK
jgi:hypothetical protein